MKLKPISNVQHSNFKISQRSRYGMIFAFHLRVVLYLFQAVCGRARPPSRAFVHELSPRPGQDNSSAAAGEIGVLARVSPEPAVVHLPRFRHGRWGQAAAAVPFSTWHLLPGNERARRRVGQNAMQIDERWECSTLCAINMEACLYRGGEETTPVSRDCSEGLS